MATGETTRAGQIETDTTIPVVVAGDKHGIGEAVIRRPFAVIIPEGQTEIDASAFQGCCGLITVTIPEGVTSIGDSAFEGCSELTSVIIPKRVTSIADGAFRYCCDLTTVTVPEGVTSIGNAAFEGCSGLTTVTIPEGVTSIGDGAFAGCSGLTSVSIPNAAIDEAFSDCPGLLTVTFRGDGEGLALGPLSFQNCERLSFVIAPPHLHEGWRESDAFYGCPLLTRLEDNTEKNRLKALHLRYWSARTHGLCLRGQQECVVTVFLVALRLEARGSTVPRLPVEMWHVILEFVPLTYYSRH